VVDGQGVALAAIQGLTQELRTLQAENAALAARVARLEGRPQV
jgi:cell division protein FtsB